MKNTCAGEYVREGGLDEKEMLEGMIEPDFGQDFLVLVIEVRSD